jgi:spore coat-associated protein N
MQAVHYTQRQRTGSQVPRRLAITIGVAAAVSLLFIFVIPMTFGQFTAQTTNVDNEFVAGTLEMTNSRNNTFIVSATGMKPGDVETGTVKITNSRNLPFSLSLDQTNVTNSGSANLAAQLDLQIEDENGLVLYDGKFNSLPSTSIDGSGADDQWEAGESREFTFTVTFPSGSGNSYQGTSASASFVWNAVQ